MDSIRKIMKVVKKGPIKPHHAYCSALFIAIIAIAAFTGSFLVPDRVAAVDCQDYNGDEGACNSNGCTWDTADCSDFNNDEGSCTGSGCSYDGGTGDCTGSYSPGTCSGGCSDDICDAGDPCGDGYDENDPSCGCQDDICDPADPCGDGYDENDPSCSQPEDCGNEVDDDGDSDVDCADSDCSEDPSCDATPPSLNEATVNGTTLTLTYNETLDGTSVPIGNDFLVNVNAGQATISGVQVTDNTVILTLTPTVNEGNTVTFNYTAGGSPIQDLNGNDASNENGHSVTNNTDTTVPHLTSATVNLDTLTLNYDEALSTGNNPDTGDFTVRVGGSSLNISNAEIIGSTVSLTIDPVTQGASVTVNYTPGTYPVEDLAGNNAASFLEYGVTNQTDTTAPTITSVTSSTSNGSYNAGDEVNITVNFSEAVTSTGLVTVTLETGATDRTCTFSVTSSTSGTCQYTVQAGDTSSDLTTNLIAGTIRDVSVAANNMVNFTPVTNLAASKAIVIDTTDPSAPGTPNLDSGSDSGTSSTDDITSDNTPTFNISCEDAATVTLLEGGTTLGSATCSGGTAAVTSSSLSDTAHTIKAKQTDVAGNISADSSTISVMVDATAPVLSSVTPATSDTIDNATTSSDIAFTLSEAIASGSVTVTRTSGTADGSSPHSCTLKGTALNSGSHTLDLSDTTNGCTSDVSDLVSGAVYTFVFDGMDTAGNSAVTVTRTSVSFGSAASSGSSDSGQGSSGSSAPTGGSTGYYYPSETYNAVNTVASTTDSVTHDVNPLCPIGLVCTPIVGLNLPKSNAQVDLHASLLRYGFVKNLEMGDKDRDVARLQVFLNAQGFTVSKTGAGSKGNETTTFGAKTKYSLQAFQRAFGIKPPTGFFGPLTRALINSGLWK